METPNDSQPPTQEEGEPQSPRSYWVAVAALVLLLGIVAFALFRRQTPAPAMEPPPLQVEQVEGEVTPGVISAEIPDGLTPEARIIAERYRCVCGCGDPLSICTCTNTPGSRDMKRHLQSLVSAGRMSVEVDAGMIEKYGPQVLLSNPAEEP